MLLDHIELGSDERVIRVVRKHWYILFTEIVGFILLCILPIPLALALLSYAPEAVRAPLEAFEVRSVIAFYALWTLALAGAFFHAITDYYLDVWVITSERVVAIDQRGLFHRTVASFRLERLQNIDVTINGIVATFLDFGTLAAETAAHDHHFILKGVANPREVKGLILGVAEKSSSPFVQGGAAHASTQPLTY